MKNTTMSSSTGFQKFQTREVTNIVGNSGTTTTKLNAAAAANLQEDIAVSDINCA